MKKARWTEPEDAIVRENYRKGGIPRLMELLPHRTREALKTRVVDLGLTKGASRPRSATCMSGHERNETNTRAKKNGDLVCRICHAASSKERLQRWRTEKKAATDVRKFDSAALLEQIALATPRRRAA